MTDLRPKEQAFVEAYVGEALYNATQSARLAGYKGSDNVLATRGYKLLQKPSVQKAIQEATEWTRRKARWSREDKLRLIERVLNGEMQDVYSHKEKGWVDGDVKLDTLLKWLQEHNKMCGDYPTEKHEHEHTVVRVSDDTPTHEIEARVRVLKNGEG